MFARVIVSSFTLQESDSYLLTNWCLYGSTATGPFAGHVFRTLSLYHAPWHHREGGWFVYTATLKFKQLHFNPLFSTISLGIRPICHLASSRQYFVWPEYCDWRPLSQQTVVVVAITEGCFAVIWLLFHYTQWLTFHWGLVQLNCQSCLSVCPQLI